MKKVILFFCFLIIVKASAQKYELGKVTKDELEEKVHPNDPSAEAALLFKIGELKIEYSSDGYFIYNLTVKIRLKIYKKEGYNWASNYVDYINSGDNKEIVIFSNASTYNLNEGKIERTKLKSDGEFDEKINKVWNRKKIVLPKVKEGSVLEYEYTINSPNLEDLRQWDFQTNIPINYNEFKTLVPEYFKYTLNRKGSIQPKILIENNQRTIMTNQTARVSYNFALVQSAFLYGRIDYTEIRSTYSIENIPSLKDELYVNNIENYNSSVKLELSATNFPNQPIKNYATSWEDITKKIYEDDEFGKQLDKRNYYEDDLNTLLHGLSTNGEKAATIFRYVQSRMTWNKYNSYYCDGGVKKAYQEKTGNSAEINLMLVSMLRFAGLDSNPVLVSTRANGVALYPSRTAYNTVIASAMIDGKLILLDATSKYSLPNILPSRDLNWFGRIIRKDETSDMVDLMPNLSSQDVVNMLATIDAKGQVSGKVREQYLDYYGLRFRENYSGVSKESIMEKMEKRNSGLEVSDYELNDKDLGEPVVEKYAFKDSNEADIIGDKIYFSPLLQFAAKENPFKQETREYPVDFSFPTKDKYLFTITIPDGYQIESLPKQVALAMDKGYGNFSLAISNTDNQIQVTGNLSINYSIVPADDYDILKEFFKKVIEKENEKIVLKKI